jgi:very-short-patch-repair endonuclease
MSLHNKKKLKIIRKDLRNNATSAEAYLWKQLSKSQLEGRKFRRQHSITKFVVDFYCASERLIIELDGKVHQNFSTAEYDQKRTAYLNRMGYSVIRFENKMVFDNLPSVLQEITKNFG